ncbi:hypothetical protein [Cupriavidus sp. CuC1]|uniref:hypothetical protein n=1 Tax=Cupriavidus sp. CuC1 TaxID=3373131 RepID=UPI0037CFFF37
MSGADSSRWNTRLGVRMHRTFVREDTRKMRPYALSTGGTPAPRVESRSTRFRLAAVSGESA